MAFRQDASTALAESTVPTALTKKVTPDRGRIDTSDVDQIKYLSRHLGVSEEELLRAVDKVGNSTSAVRKELGK
jgi:Protein of unknown function (DUF3606)